MKVLFTAALLCLTAMCFAQKQNVYFLKNNGSYVQNRDSADYIRVVREPDSASTLYNVFEFYLNGSNKLIGKSSVIDPPKYEGACVVFYKNGKRKSILNYKAGNLTGDQFENYPNGKPYLVENYYDNHGNEDSGVDDNYTITAEYDSLGTALVTDGNGYYKEYDDKFKNVVYEGNIKNGKKDGAWKGMDEGQHLHFIEMYENGTFISGISVGEKGDTVKYTKSNLVEPQYKGGLKEFYNFISRNVDYPDYEKQHNIQGKVILAFIVEKDGKISNIKILEGVSDNINA
jgi:antitoxin component YwqK of YwqJK toxin-antitoxin module